MNGEEIRAAAKVMEAYADGKKVQKQDINGLWIDCDNPMFDWASFNYRIKAEPKYRPFKTQEECWQEMHRHPDFGWVIELNSQEYLHIVRLSHSEITKRFCITFSCDEGYNKPFDKMLSDYTFTDGEPFGIKEG